MIHAAIPSGLAEREAALLAPYAQASAASRGRKHPEAPHPYRGPYQRDRDRVLHSAAFRRLSQKTQVFTGHELGDYHRTRLTHTLEGTSIARTVGRALRLNEDLIEALMLMHDMGHPPYGHSGEDALDGCLAAHGGFNHNAQALRIVEELEFRAAHEPGLNLCYETLAGQRCRVEKRGDGEQPPLEAQTVDAADSIAYDSHDPDDALHYQLLSLGELQQVPLWSAACARVRRNWAALADGELRRAVIHELIEWQVSDLISATRNLLMQHGIASPAAVRSAPRLVAPSGEMRELKVGLEKFLYDRIYRHPRLLAARDIYQRKLQDLFAAYCARPERLPPLFQNRIVAAGLERTVGDYLAGMTDRFAELEHQRRTAANDRCDPDNRT